jgi:enamine deaminase RidA (YjgF/YER057c/UK114 family)
VSDTPEARLAALGLVLPSVAAPVAAYVPALRSGSLVYTAGQLPLVGGELLMTGKVGEQVSVVEAAALARTCALNALSAIASVLDGLSPVVRIVRLTGFVASAPGFTDHSKVVNGASELLLEVFGEAGRHARSAVGVTSLPFDAPVELELIAEAGD